MVVVRCNEPDPSAAPTLYNSVNLVTWSLGQECRTFACRCRKNALPLTFDSTHVVALVDRTDGGDEMKHAVIGVIAVFGIPTLAAAQTQPVRVAVDASIESNDVVGNRLVYAVKEQLRKSQAFRLMTETDSAAIVLRIVTLDPDQSIESVPHGARSVASIVWTVKAVYWTHEVMVTGSDRVQERAEDIVADTDRIVDAIRKTITTKQ